jgi:hypothetical protein
VTTWTVNTGNWGTGRVELTLTVNSQNATANNSVIGIRCRIMVPGGTWWGTAQAWSASGLGGGSWSGTVAAPSSSSDRWITVLDTTRTVAHAANGTLTTSASFTGPASGTSAFGGPNTVSSGNWAVPTLTRAPGQVTNVVGTRNSDTQVTVTWTHNYATNGVPTGTGIDQTVNGGAWTRAATYSGAPTSGTVATAANRRTQYRIATSNGAGSAPNSATSAAVFTTPAAPTNVAVVKAANGITVSWTNNVGFSEYGTQVQHGTVSGGVTTWDAVNLGTAASGATSYLHANPNAAQVHVYRVRASNTTGGLSSAWVTSATVQLQAPPIAPTLVDIPNFLTVTSGQLIGWKHNPVDASAQTAYELQWSTDGGTTWAGTGKVTSTAQTYALAANTWPANTVVTFRVRTWGAATTGGADNAGASPWSTLDSTRFVTLPTLAITAPTDTISTANTTVALAFAQGQGGTLVTATVTLWQGAVLLETVTTTTTTAALSTRLRDGVAYQVQAVATDSFGQRSTMATADFFVDYLDPVAALISAAYLPDQGAVQIGLSLPGVPDTVLRTNLATNPSFETITEVPFPTTGDTIRSAVTNPDYFDGDAPGDAFTEKRWTGTPHASTSVLVFKTYPVTVTLTRSIDGGPPEAILDRFPWTGDPITILDTTPSIHGTNTYEVTTYTAEDAASQPSEATVTTNEERWAFLNAGPGFADVVAFYGNLTLASSPARTTALVTAAGRSRPIALYGEVSTLDVSGTATILDDEGSTVQELEAFILTAGRVCYRDPSGRRMFGALDAKIDGWAAHRAAFSYTVSEAT